MSTGLKANSDGSAAIQVGGSDVITLTSGGAATFLTSPTTVQAGTAAAPSITFSGDTNTGIYSPGADQVAIATGGTKRFEVDAAGNAGLGVTPSAWSTGSSVRAFQNPAGGLWNFGTNYQFLGQNYYFNSSNQRIYLTTAAASEYAQVSGQHQWFNAASGTAGNTITFTQAMTLDASGNLGIGETSPAAPLHIKSATNNIMRLQSSDNVTGNIYFSFLNSSGTQKGYIGYGSSVDDSLQIQNEANSYMTFGTNGTERARITSGGRLNIGTTGGSASRLEVIGPETMCYFVNETATDATYRTTIGFTDSGGSIRGTIKVNNSATQYNTSSDYRLKENVQPMVGALDKVSLLKPCTFNWKIDGHDGQGFIAHELAEVFPDAVAGEKDAIETYTDSDGNEQTRPAYQGIDTSFLVATLTAAIQEQQAMIDELKAKVAALEGA